MIDFRDGFVSFWSIAGKTSLRIVASGRWLDENDQARAQIVFINLDPATYQIVPSQNRFLPNLNLFDPGLGFANRHSAQLAAVRLQFFRRPIAFPMAPMAEVSGYRSGSAERKESSDTSASSSRGFKTYGTPMGSAGTRRK